VDPPLADVVSFAERARARRGEGVAQEADAEAVVDEPKDGIMVPASEKADAPVGVTGSADLAREAMFRRFGQLARNGSETHLRSIDDELAVLVYDSATELEPLVGVRGHFADATRQLTFQGPELVIEVQLAGRGRELTCQVVPPQPVSLEVRHGTGTVPLGTDDFGTFHVPELPSGAVSLRCVPLTGEAGPTSTSWITVSDRPYS
jgi:hypothetical protein